MRTYTLKPGNVVNTSYYKRLVEDGTYAANSLSMMVVVAVAGAYSQYVQLAGINGSGTTGRFKTWVWLGSKEQGYDGNAWQVMWPTVLEYALAYQKADLETLYKSRIQRAERKAEVDSLVKAHELSRNTVTRALIHAHENGYCNETAVALIGAGHKLPVGYLEVKVEATIRLELNGAKDYYILRELYGRSRGELSKLIGESNYKLNDHIYGKAVTIASLQSAKITEIDLEIPAPVIRPTEEARANNSAFWAEAGLTDD